MHVCVCVCGRERDVCMQVFVRMHESEREKHKKSHRALCLCMYVCVSVFVRSRWIDMSVSLNDLTTWALTVRVYLSALGRASLNCVCEPLCRLILSVCVCVCY
jgi:hypothetical protein